MDAFADRGEAGRLLTPGVVHALARLGAGAPGAAAGLPPLVLGLPRGGVPVAAEVAAALGAPLDVLVVRKLGVPDHPELAFGAIASGGARVINPDVVVAEQLSEDDVAAVIADETRELHRRERAYRGARPLPAVTGRTVVVVDDGLATGATMRVAVLALRGRGAAAVLAAAPVGTDDACALLAGEADAVVCPLVPVRFRAVGAWYGDFAPVDDATVSALLDHPPSAPPSAHATPTPPPMPRR
jgi:putative phosphoribosyl transferase